MRRAVLLAALTIALQCLQAAPARADHTDALAHWGHWYSPLVYADCRQFGGQLCQFTGNAESIWSDNSYPNGFQTEQPFPAGVSPCGDLIAGWIMVCVVPAETTNSSGVKGLSANGQFAYGRTLSGSYVNNPYRHRHWTRIDLCGNCGYTAAFLKAVVAHEYGHAIGLGDRSTDSSDIMYASRAITNTSINVTAHDRSALTTMYDRNHEAELQSGLKVYATYGPMISYNGSYRLNVQRDGNLVVYSNITGKPVWATGTTGAWMNGDHVIWMYPDGRVILYHQQVDGSYKAICYTKSSQGFSGSRLRLGSDGNLVVYYGASTPVWQRSQGCTRI